MQLKDLQGLSEEIEQTWDAHSRRYVTWPLPPLTRREAKLLLKFNEEDLTALLKNLKYLGMSNGDISRLVDETLEELGDADE